MRKTQHHSAESRAPQLAKARSSRRPLRGAKQGADSHVLIPELVWDPVQISNVSARKCWQIANNALVDSFSLIGYKFERVLCERSPSSSVSELMSILKQWTAFWLPHMLHDQTPEQRFNPYSLCSSSFRTYIRNRVTGGGTKRKIAIGALILYSKRLFPSFTKEMVREKVSDFSKSVARPEPEVLPRKRRIFREIDITVHEEIIPEGMMVADYRKAFPPSVSACFENSRSDGGIQGHVRKNILRDFLDDPFVRESLELEKLEFLENDVNLRVLWEGMLEKLIWEAMMEVGLPGEDWKPIQVGATGLTEPLKVRIVTKAQWVLQLLTPIQKAWHGQMRKNPIFELIGGVEVEESIRDMRTGKGEKIVSGDYSAATDNIFLTYTRHAAEAMLERTEILLPPSLPPVYGEFLRKLALHSLVKSVLVLKGSDPVMITRGQMMGHILSFPLLCIINRAASCMAIPRSRFMRINGDDVIFPASPREYKKWKSATRCVGLEFSVGKNYYSNSLALVNSVFCIYDKEQARWTPVPVPNVGLLNLPLDKQVDLNNGRQILPWEVLSSRFNQFVRTSDRTNWKRYLDMFRKYNPILRGFPGPVYGPREYGALGAPVPTSKYQFTKNQLLWMNAHRLGIFSYLEGTRTDYTRVCNFYQGVIQKELLSDLWSWGPTHPGEAYGPMNRMGDGLNPYERDGGLGASLMAMRRWIHDLSSTKHIRIFGARRWNRFKLERSKSGGIPPLPANFLNKVLSNSVWSLAPRWHNKRDLVGVRYEDDASFLHEIFRAP